MCKEWHVIYFFTKDDIKPVEEYIDNLPTSGQAKTAAFISLLEDKGPNLQRPYADLLKDGIHELRLKLKGTQVRILYFFCYQNIIVLTNVFDKHTPEVPEAEIKLAQERRADFLDRNPEKTLRGLI